MGLADRARSAHEIRAEAERVERQQKQQQDMKTIARKFAVRFCGGGEVPPEIYATMRPVLDKIPPCDWLFHYDGLDFKAEQRWKDVWEVRWFVARPVPLLSRKIGNIVTGKPEVKWVQIHTLAQLGQAIAD